MQNFRLPNEIIWNYHSWLRVATFTYKVWNIRELFQEGLCKNNNLRIWIKDYVLKFYDVHMLLYFSFKNPFVKHKKGLERKTKYLNIFSV